LASKSSNSTISSEVIEFHATMSDEVPRDDVSVDPPSMTGASVDDAPVLRRRVSTEPIGVHGAEVSPRLSPVLVPSRIHIPSTLPFYGYHPPIPEEKAEDEVPSPNYAAPPTGPRVFVIDGRPIEVLTQPNQFQGTVRPMYPRSVRLRMDIKAFNDFSREATKQILTPLLDLLSPSLSAGDRLDDVYNLTQHVTTLRNHCIKFDMADVFQVVPVTRQDVNRGVLSSHSPTDLFANYSTLSNQDVALSTEWYRTWTNPLSEPSWEQNLVLTLELLEKNCTSDLWNKCLETHMSFPPIQQGGPLMFRIIMDKLQSDTEDAVQHLCDTVKALKISEQVGENVSRLASLIRTAHRRLHNVRRVPPDFNKWVLSILQTSSNPTFNELFRFIHLQLSANQRQAAVRVYPDFNELLTMAERHYLEMTATNEWSGVTRVGHNTVFLASQSSPAAATTSSVQHSRSSTRVCWNCGDLSHTLDACPQPRNEADIEIRRRATRTASRAARESRRNAENQSSDAPAPTSTSSGNKFSPPLPHERNKRVINGVPMYWIPRTRRWVKDRQVVTSSVAPTVPSSDDGSISRTVNSVNLAFSHLRSDLA
jgi:hypothetical protein